MSSLWSYMTCKLERAWAQPCSYILLNAVQSTTLVNLYVLFILCVQNGKVQLIHPQAIHCRKWDDLELICHGEITFLGWRQLRMAWICSVPCAVKQCRCLKMPVARRAAWTDALRPTITWQLLVKHNWNESIVEASRRWKQHFCSLQANGENKDGNSARYISRRKETIG